MFVGATDSNGVYAVFFKELGGSGGSVDRIAFFVQFAAGFQHIDFRFGRSRRDHHVLFRDVVSHCDHRVQQRFVEVVSEASYLAGRSHVDAENRIRFQQACERELRSLDADVIDVEFVRFCVRSV